jgi:hypothetical protein
MKQIVGKCFEDILKNSSAKYSIFCREIIIVVDDLENSELQNC